MTHQQTPPLSLSITFAFPRNCGKEVANDLVETLRRRAAEHGASISEISESVSPPLPLSAVEIQGWMVIAGAGGEELQLSRDGAPGYIVATATADSLKAGIWTSDTPPACAQEIEEPFSSLERE